MDGEVPKTAISPVLSQLSNQFQKWQFVTLEAYPSITITGLNMIHSNFELVSNTCAEILMLEVPLVLNKTFEGRKYGYKHPLSCLFVKKLRFCQPIVEF